MHKEGINFTPAARNLLIASILALAISGLGQMPLFKRYYISDLPGLFWLSDFMIQHLLHYTAAIVFSILVGMWLGRVLATRSWSRVSTWTWIQAGLFFLLVLTGMFRVIKNMSWFGLSPLESLLTVQLHLAAAFLLGLTALARWIAHAPGVKSRFERSD